MDNLKEKILALPRPDHLNPKYVIEAELEDIVALVEAQTLQMRIDIEYAIGYCQGLGNPCKYLESHHGTPKPSTNGDLVKGAK